MLKPNMVMCYVESLFASTKDKWHGVQLEAVKDAIEVLQVEQEVLEQKIAEHTLKVQMDNIRRQTAGKGDLLNRGL